MFSLKKLLNKIISGIYSPENEFNLELIERYREFDRYNLTLEVYPGAKIHIPPKLLSEPPEGITYEFNPSGYIGNIDSDYCVVPTTWRNPNNYCHWNFSELPFLFLAFESNANNIVLPDSFMRSRLPFQKRWLEILISAHPSKTIQSLSKAMYPDDSLIPINHDTSNSTKLIGKCQYRHYHHSRATPYLLHRINHFYLPVFNGSYNHERIYINRSSRRLVNEIDFQGALKKIGFEIINLEGLSLDDQVSAFAKAKVIVGFHGAGLSNLIYSNEFARVFEIVDSDCVHPCFLDGIVIPGKKATRTYFHMVCFMKGIDYTALESKAYVIDIDQAISAIQSH